MRAMEVTVKLRLLLTSALFVFAQVPTMQAQETLDLAKITCEQFMMEKLAWTSRDVVLFLAGYYNGKRNNTELTRSSSFTIVWGSMIVIVTNTAIRLSWMPSRTCSV